MKVNRQLAVFYCLEKSMATNLGTLTLNLIANTGSYTQGLRNAESSTDSAFKKMRGAVNTYGNVVGAVAASAIVGLAGLAYQTAQSAVELEKFALRANSSTQEFQKMAVGAAAYGIQQEKLSDMLKDFNEKLGEFTTIGSGEAVDFFEQIATKTEGSAAGAKKLALEMQKLSGPDALQLYVDKMQEAGVTQQQMSFYLESMASDMTDLIPLLINGGEGMKLYSDAAERAGLVMNEKTIASSKILKEQVYLLDLQLRGAKNQLMQAVIPAFVDIAGAFFSGSEQGLQFTEVADGVAKSLKGVASVAIGAVTAIQLVGKTLGGMAAVGGAIFSEANWYEMNPIGLVKAAYDARKEIGALTTEIKSDLHNTVIGAAERMDKMWEGNDASTAKQMASLKELSKTQSGVTNGLDEWVDKQNKSSDATNRQSKAQTELNRLLEKQYYLRKSLIYEFSSDIQRMKLDYESVISDINDANFSPALRSQFLSAAKARFEDEQVLYKMKQAFELQEHKVNEEAKAKATFIIDQQIIANRTDINTAEKQQYLNALQEKHTRTMAWLQLEQNMRLNDASQAFQTEMQNIAAKYEFERQQIRLNSKLSKDERDALISASRITESIDSAQGRDSTLYAYLGAAGIDTAAEQAAAQRSEAFQAALDWQLITQEEYQQKMLESESLYYRAKAALGVQDAANTTAGMADLMSSLLGEQSAGYKAMFIASKMFALSKVLLNAPETFSNVYNSVSAIPMIGPYIAPFVAGGALAVQLGQAAQIRSMNLQGFATGGHITGKGTGTSDEIPIWASNGEFMIRAASVEKLGLANLDYINRTGMLPQKFATGGAIGKERFLSNPIRPSEGININVYTLPGTTADVTENRDGSLDVRIRSIARDEVKQGFANLNQANSFESKQVRNNIAAGRVR